MKCTRIRCYNEFSKILAGFLFVVGTGETNISPQLNQFLDIVINENERSEHFRTANFTVPFSVEQNGKDVFILAPRKGRTVQLVQCEGSIRNNAIYLKRKYREGDKE